MRLHEVAALVLTIASALCLYLTAPRQQWLPRPCPKVLRWAAFGLSLVALWFWILVWQPFSGATLMLVFYMALWTLFPAIGVLLQVRSGRHS